MPPTFDAQPLAMRVLPFIAAVIVLIPLPWHWRARNVATLSMILFLFLSNLLYGVKAILWDTNAEVKAVVFCDIVVRYEIFATMALPAASLCLTRRLEQASSARTVRLTAADKRRRTIVDLILCFLVPLIPTGAYYIVQGHRFDIIENIGCRAAIYVSWPAIIIIWIPPLLLSLTSCVYAALALRNFIVSRASFSKHLQASQSSLTISRFLRLIAMALVEMCWGLTILLLNMYTTLRPGLRPYDSWADVHSNFSRIAQFPMVLFPKTVRTLLYLDWWAIPVSAALFFAFFAFGQDAMREYTASVLWFRRRVLRQAAPLDRHAANTMRYTSRPHKMLKDDVLTIDISASKAGAPTLPSFSKSFRTRTEHETGSRYMPSWLPAYYGGSLDVNDDINDDKTREPTEPPTPTTCDELASPAFTDDSRTVCASTRAPTPSSCYIAPYAASASTAPHTRALTPFPRPSSPSVYSTSTADEHAHTNRMV